MLISTQFQTAWSEGNRRVDKHWVPQSSFHPSLRDKRIVLSSGRLCQAGVVFWQESLKAELPRLEQKPPFYHFKATSRLSLAAVVLSERKHRPLAREKWNIMMLSWAGGGGLAEKICHAKDDGCCFVNRNCWNAALSPGSIISLFLLFQSGKRKCSKTPHPLALYFLST